ncbi:MAG: outer membrane beta-barrel protein [Saprospiraceae bacterium]
MRLLITCLIITFFTLQGYSQNEQYYNLENQKYYLSSIQDNIESLRVYSDSATIWPYLDKMSIITNDIDTELNKIVVEAPIEEEMVEETIETEGDTKEETLENYPWDNDKKGDMDDDDDSGMSKFIPFRNKIKTDFVIQFGVNGLMADDNLSGENSPEINTGGSWFWDFGISRKVRIGNKTSKVATYYGISYLINRFKINNDLRLSTVGDNGVWIDETLVSNRINIGYLNIPVGLIFKIGKKSSIQLGGYAGYRVYTAQNLHIENGSEDIYQKRKDRYGLNNWMYGAQAGLDLKGFDLNFKYNFSTLFENPSPTDSNIWMIGTSIRI